MELTESQSLARIVRGVKAATRIRGTVKHRKQLSKSSPSLLNEVRKGIVSP